MVKKFFRERWKGNPKMTDEQKESAELHSLFVIISHIPNKAKSYFD